MALTMSDEQERVHRDKLDVALAVFPGNALSDSHMAAVAAFKELDATRAALAKCERSLAAAQAEYVEARSFAAFGSWVFESFWHDGEPGDVEAIDAQEKAVELGLLGRTSETDPAAAHAEGCDCSPGAPAAECCCYVPTRRPLDIARPVGSVEALKAHTERAIEATARRAAKIAEVYEQVPTEAQRVCHEDCASAAILNELCDPDDPDRLRLVARLLEPTDAARGMEGEGDASAVE